MVKIIKLVIRIWSTALFFIFLAVAISGGLTIGLVKAFMNVGIGILIFGIVGVVASIVGFISARFNKLDDGKAPSKVVESLLVAFFAVMLILHIVYMVFGVSLISLRPSVKMIIALPVDKFNKIYNSLPKSFTKTSVEDAIGKIQTFALGVGIGMILVAVLIFITCIGISCLVGKLLFTRFFVISFSIVEVIVGIAIGVFLLIIAHIQDNYIFGNKFPVGEKVTIPIIVLGFVLAVIGVIGLVTPCAGYHKLISAIFNTGNIVLLLAFVVLFILSIVYRRTLDSWGRALCPVIESEGGGEVNACDETLQKAITNYCRVPDLADTCYDVDDLKADITLMAQHAAIILWFVCMYMALFLGFVAVTTFIGCRTAPDEQKNKNVVYVLTEPILDYNYY